MSTIKTTYIQHPSSETPSIELLANGTSNLPGVSTDGVAEGISNLYHTDARVLSVAVDKSGDAMTGVLSAPNYNVGVEIVTDSDQYTIDFSSGSGLIDFSNDLVKNSLTFYGSNYTPGAIKTLFVQNVNIVANEIPLYFPQGWVWTGAMPSSISYGKKAIFTVTSFGTTEEKVVAGWVAEG